MKKATLLFLIDDHRILLAMKKRGFGVGRWNGVGGKPQKNESVTETAVRECQEEIQVTPLNIKTSAKLNFYFPETRKEWNQQVIVFVCKTWQGQPTETEEMAPKWFNIDKLPYEKMWSDDKFWLPQVIKGQYVSADFYFDNNDQLLKQRISVA